MAESCISCGRDTAVGTNRFSTRKRGRDRHTGEEGYICHACEPDAQSQGAEQRIPLSGRYVVIDLPGGLPG